MLIEIFRAAGKWTSSSVVRRLFNLYPPFIGSGIKVQELSADYKYLKVILKLRFYNKNYVGTQFGGSIFSMTDPHYMLLLIKNLGPEYRVLDKAAHIEFVKPGKTHLVAEFRITDELIELIKEKTKNGEKYLIDLPVSVHDIHGEVVAKLTKTLYVRLKNK